MFCREVNFTRMFLRRAKERRGKKHREKRRSKSVRRADESCRDSCLCDARKNFLWRREDSDDTSRLGIRYGAINGPPHKLSRHTSGGTYTHTFARRKIQMQVDIDRIGIQSIVVNRRSNILCLRIRAVFLRLFRKYLSRLDNRLSLGISTDTTRHEVLLNSCDKSRRKKRFCTLITATGRRRDR